MFSNCSQFFRQAYGTSNQKPLTNMADRTELCFQCCLSKSIHFVDIRLVKNLKNANLILASNFEVFWGLSSKNLKIIGSNLPQSLNLKPKTATLILTSNFEAFWGFFKINLKYFSLPSTSKKPQTFFEVFLEDPQKPHTVHKIHQAFKTQGRLYRVTIK